MKRPTRLYITLLILIVLSGLIYLRISLIRLSTSIEPATTVITDAPTIYTSPTPTSPFNPTADALHTDNYLNHPDPNLIQEVVYKGSLVGVRITQNIYSEPQYPAYLMFYRREEGRWKEARRIPLTLFHDNQDGMYNILPSPDGKHLCARYMSSGTHGSVVINVSNGIEIGRIGGNGSISDCQRWESDTVVTIDAHDYRDPANTAIYSFDTAKKVFTQMSASGTVFDPNIRLK